MDDGFFSTPEVASALGVTYEDALSFAEEAELPRVGRSYIWDQSAVDALAAELEEDGDEEEDGDADDVDDECDDDEDGDADDDECDDDDED